MLFLGRHTRYVLVAVSRMVPADSGWLWACNGSREWSVCVHVLYIRTYVCVHVYSVGDITICR